MSDGNSGSTSPTDHFKVALTSLKRHSEAQLEKTITKIRYVEMMQKDRANMLQRIGEIDNELNEFNRDPTTNPVDLNEVVRDLMEPQRMEAEIGRLVDRQIVVMGVRGTMARLVGEVLLGKLKRHRLLELEKVVEKGLESFPKTESNNDSLFVPVTALNAQLRGRWAAVSVAFKENEKYFIRYD